MFSRDLMKSVSYKVVCVCCIMSITLALVPVNLSIIGDDVQVSPNRAHAVAPVAPYALEFLQAAAARAGITMPQYIASVVGIGTMATGMSFGSTAGIKLGDSAYHMLDNLIETADYPPFEDLTTEEQESWGSAERYNAAKFNTLMDAFGLDSARDRFYSSGGGNFEWQNDEIEKLEQLGSIANNWAAGGYNTIKDLISPLVSNYTDVFLTFAQPPQFVKVKGEDYSQWPTNAPEDLYVNKGSLLQVITSHSQTQNLYQYRVSGKDVYWLLWGYDNNFYSTAFSKEPFTYGSSSQLVTIGQATGNPPSPSRNASSNTINGHTYYLLSTTLSTANLVNCNMKMNGNTNLTNRETWVVLEQILFGDEINIAASTVPIVGYPEDVTADEDLEVYYPENGVYEGMSWENFVTPNTGGGGSGGEIGTDYTAMLQRIIQLLEQNQYDSAGNLKVFDTACYRMLQEISNTIAGIECGCPDYTEILNSIKTYVGEGFQALDDDISGIRDDLAQIIAILRTPDVHDIVGDFDYDDLQSKALAIQSDLAQVAPFGALGLFTAAMGVWTTTSSFIEPTLSFPFYFAGHEIVTIDLSWLADGKPLINFVMISFLIFTLVNASLRIIEMEATR